MMEILKKYILITVATVVLLQFITARAATYMQVAYPSTYKVYVVVCLNSSCVSRYGRAGLG